MRAARLIATTFVLPPLLLLFCCVSGLQAEPALGRAALLIANAAYPDSDAVLATPVADSQALADELKRRGFSVEVAENLTKEAMQAAIDRFAKRIESGSTAFVFFGGYGIQVARKNYLIPVDARIWSEADVLRDGLAVDGLLADLDRRGARNRVLVLDASRRNPFERRFRSFSTGLAPAKAAPGTLTLYSAAAGSVVNEGNANRSLFVTELAKQIGLPDQTAEQAFGGTRDALSKATRNQQNPALASGLEEAFSFDPNRKPTPKPVASADPPMLPEPVEPKVPPAETPALPPVEKPIEKPKAPPVETEVLPPKAPETPPPVATLPAAKWSDPPKTIPEPPKAKPVEEPAAADPGPLGPVTPPKTPSKPPPVADLDKEADSPLSAEDEAVRDFNAANATGTIPAYRDFLSRHPTGSLAARARAEIVRLEAVPQAPPPAKETAPYSDSELKRKAALDQRIVKNPRDALAYYERGQFHAQRGDAATAVTDFDQSIRLDPTSAEAYNNRCWMRAVLNDLQRALDDCNKALGLRRNFVDALDSRGFVNLKLGEYRAAVADYDAALRVDASHGSSLYGRGVAKRRLGQTASGDKDLAGALQLNPAIDQEFSQYGLR